ncbi:Neuromedin-S [Fukomys damarensis]|uniref:Neuromedin-S n=1 Tax=Fukomys damarensis TaxID=885580 RepID=A0A091DYE0_FUKDA|nr:Neuromedin-S [Fukomys damarensis]
MKQLPELPSVLAMYCFCMIQIISSGFLQPLAHPPDGLDIVQLEFPPVHPLMRLAAELASRKMKRFPQRDSGPAAVDLTKKTGYPHGKRIETEIKHLPKVFHYIEAELKPMSS